MTTVLPLERLSMRCADWSELSRDEAYAIFVLRDLVFVVGQKITSEPEVDGRDPECMHCMLWLDEQLIGTLRVFREERPRMVVGRVAIHPDYQRGGYGTWLMERLQAKLAGHPAELHAQAHLEAWYARLGWRRIGEVFYEAEIPHVMMVWGDV